MKQFLIAAFALMLAGCGFTPLYANGGKGGQISVEQIEGRSGHALRKALLQDLAAGLPGLDGPATLTVVLDEDLARLALQPDEAATRTDIIVRADYVLATDAGTVSGNTSAETSFLVPDAPFADIAAQVDGSDRAMTLLSRRIVNELRLSLAKSK